MANLAGMRFPTMDVTYEVLGALALLQLMADSAVCEHLLVPLAVGLKRHAACAHVIFVHDIGTRWVNTRCREPKIVSLF